MCGEWDPQGRLGKELLNLTSKVVWPLLNYYYIFLFNQLDLANVDEIIDYCHCICKLRMRVVLENRK